ncbi:citryl-CoA lyase [Castellaniella defragrans]|uniref:citrate synthase (unknown stereospecificity) n=2 Tax=Castellaniella defragrans TaxID=75697 RepID=W8WSX0_CASD6|nr:citryl-CoA lyase [Castellaniella defragrans]KAB0622937.1 citryl-CoA lyase [Castellaniella defragrans]MBB6085350.1 citrate synthase [Castellaniella defragrans]CDM22629.1 Citrate synthase [Castellaniella defragrans 65Phen]
MTAQHDDRVDQASRWWSTDIIDIHPGEIRIRGYAIQDLIGRIGFPEMIWLMLRGELPGKAQAALLEAALVSSVDHGPHAPSIAISRMAISCGVDLNGAMGSAVNVLGDIHGGAGQQCMEIYQDCVARAGRGEPQPVKAALDAYRAAHGKIVPGFGHRFHPRDPRAKRLLALVDEAVAQGVVSGEFARIGRQVEAVLEQEKGRHIPMNIDGATAVIYSELGFAPELGRGIFILSRSVGILAHAWEQMREGRRIKGPMPPSIPYAYTGPRHAELPE